MFPDYIIENFISILNNKNSAHATAKELNYDSECDNNFLQDLQVLEMQGLVQILKSIDNNPQVLLTFKGAYYGREYINNYYKIYDDVVDLIKPDSLKTTHEIMKILGVHHIIIGAIFIDLSEQGLITYEQGLGGLTLEFSKEGEKYFKTWQNITW